MSEGKNLVIVQSGRGGALKRWQGGRIARLDALSPAQRDLIFALIGGMKAPPAVEAPEGANARGGTNTRAATAAQLSRCEGQVLEDAAARGEVVLAPKPVVSGRAR